MWQRTLTAARYGALVVLLLGVGLAQPRADVTWVVTKTADTMDYSCTPQDCSLREAVFQASYPPAVDTIWVPAGHYRLTLAGQDDLGLVGDLDLSRPVYIRGVGAGQTIIDGNGIDRVLDLHGGTVTVSDLALTGGYAGYGGAVQIQGAALVLEFARISENRAGYGAGLYVNGGSAVLRYCQVDLNHGTHFAGAVYLAAGGLTIESSTIARNVAEDFHAAILQYGGSATFLNTTISGNWSPQGAAVRVDGGTMELTKCTLVHNQPYDFTLLNGLSASFANSLIQGSCEGYVHGLSSLGGNLESPGDTCELHEDSDQHNVADPLLSGLANHGNVRPTHLPRPGSPAIDRAINASCPAIDQRGISRPLDGDGVPPAICDVGSVEVYPGESSGALFADDLEMGGAWGWSSVNP